MVAARGGFACTSPGSLAHALGKSRLSPSRIVRHELNAHAPWGLLAAWLENRNPCYSHGTHPPAASQTGLAAAISFPPPL